MSSRRRQAYAVSPPTSSSARGSTAADASARAARSARSAATVSATAADGHAADSASGGAQRKRSRPPAQRLGGERGSICGAQWARCATSRAAGGVPAFARRGAGGRTRAHHQRASGGGGAVHLPAGQDAARSTDQYQRRRVRRLRVANGIVSVLARRSIEPGCAGQRQGAQQAGGTRPHQPATPASDTSCRRRKCIQIAVAGGIGHDQIDRSLRHRGDLPAARARGQMRGAAPRPLAAHDVDHR